MKVNLNEAEILSAISEWLRTRIPTLVKPDTQIKFVGAFVSSGAVVNVDFNVDPVPGVVTTPVAQPNMPADAEPAA